MPRPLDTRQLLPIEQTTPRKDNEIALLESMTRKAILDQQQRCPQINEETIPESSSTTLKTLGQFLIEETARTGASPTASAILAFQTEQSGLQEDLLDHAMLATPAATRPPSPKAAVRTSMHRIAEDLGQAKTISHGVMASTKKSAFETPRETNNGSCWPRGITPAVHFISPLASKGNNCIRAGSQVAKINHLDYQGPLGRHLAQWHPLTTLTLAQG